MAAAAVLSPELVLVAPPEEAAYARSLLPDPPFYAVTPLAAARPAPAAAPADAGGIDLSRIAFTIYSGMLAGVASLVIAAISVHEVRVAGADDAYAQPASRKTPPRARVLYESWPACNTSSVASGRAANRNGTNVVPRPGDTCMTVPPRR